MLILLALNVLGAIGYLIAVSPSWAIPEEHESGIHSISGEPLVWAAAGWPILTMFFLLNLSWAAFILAKRQWRSGRLNVDMAGCTLGRLCSPLEACIADCSLT
jgi:hypothetical protein